jgi:peptide/nickel transport system permease protein
MMSVADLAFDTEPLAAPEEESQARVVWRRFRRHKLAVVGLAIVAFLFLAAFVGPFLVPYNAITIPSANYGATRDLGMFSRAPDGLHSLGTDSSGRDFLTRLMQGGRVSLSLAIVVVLLETLVGIVIGGISGYYGRWVDSVIMRSVDFMLTLPLLPLLLVLYVLLPMNKIPGQSVTVVAIVLVVFGWLGVARLVRGMVLSLKNQEFTEAARSVGASDRRIILRHMVPNSLAPVFVSATLAVGGVVVLEAALSYLGFGVKPPAPSWGNMLNDVQGKMLTHPFQVFYPGMAIFLISLSFNFIGDALRDSLDPRLKM